jgi:hypothetical protein
MIRNNNNTRHDATLFQRKTKNQHFEDEHMSVNQEPVHFLGQAAGMVHGRVAHARLMRNCILHGHPFAHSLVLFSWLKVFYLPFASLAFGQQDNVVQRNQTIRSSGHHGLGSHESADGWR